MRSTISVGANPTNTNSSRLTPLVVFSLLIISVGVLLPGAAEAKLHAVSWQLPAEIDLPIVAPPDADFKVPRGFALASPDEDRPRGVAGQGMLGDIMQGVGEGSELTSELVEVLDSAMPLLNLFQADISVTGVSGDMNVDFNLATISVLCFTSDTNRIFCRSNQLLISPWS